MSEELNILLIKAYFLYKDDPDPPLPIKTLKEFLELENISLDESNNGKEELTYE